MKDKFYRFISNFAIIVSLLLTVGQAYTEILYHKNIDYLWKSENHVLFDFSSANENVEFGFTYHFVAKITNLTDRTAKHISFKVSSINILDIIDIDKKFGLGNYQPDGPFLENRNYIYTFNLCTSLESGKSAMVRMASSKTINSIGVRDAKAYATCPKDNDHELDATLITCPLEINNPFILFSIFMLSLFSLIILSILLTKRETTYQGRVVQAVIGKENKDGSG